MSYLQTRTAAAVIWINCKRRGIMPAERQRGGKTTVTQTAHFMFQMLQMLQMSDQPRRPGRCLILKLYSFNVCHIFQNFFDPLRGSGYFLHRFSLSGRAARHRGHALRLLTPASPHLPSLASRAFLCPGQMNQINQINRMRSALSCHRPSRTPVVAVVPVREAVAAVEEEVERGLRTLS